MQSVLALPIVFAQGETQRVRVDFTDKKHNKYQINKPGDFFSSRSLARKHRLGVAIDNYDLPVSRYYTDSVNRTGARVICTSRWFNSAIVECTPEQYQKIQGFSFVNLVTRVSSSEEYVSRTTTESKKKLKTQKIDSSIYGKTLSQIDMLDGLYLHDNHLTGRGMLIAVLDAGFKNADINDVFDGVRSGNRIAGTRDIADPGGDVFNHNYHGMTVLSLMAGSMSGVMKGTAPDASYLLIRTEVNSVEEIAEEEYWIAGAEYADSMGADVINSSLGYNLFDDTSQNHNREQLDGRTSRVSLGADMAVKKGMVVVVSAGNEGRKEWKKITFPADSRHVLTVGAINSEGEKAGFSSVGPTADGRVKPEVVAQGERPYTVTLNGKIDNTSSGTSFSAPIISGLVACLWQAFPDATPLQVKEAVVKSADNYLSPDSLIGYGKPNFRNAYQILEQMVKYNNVVEGIDLYPNPTVGQLWVDIRYGERDSFDIRIIDNGGRVTTIAEKIITNQVVTTISVQTQGFPAGVYTLQATGSKSCFAKKFSVEK